MSDGTYATGDVISLTATFDSVVTVTGAPRIALTIGTASVFADVASGCWWSEGECCIVGI